MSMARLVLTSDWTTTGFSRGVAIAGIAGASDTSQVR